MPQKRNSNLTDDSLYEKKKILQMIRVKRKTEQKITSIINCNKIALLFCISMLRKKNRTTIIF
jgi:hypothetical protein